MKTITHYFYKTHYITSQNIAHHVCA